jgi:hypothetical protein
MKRNMGTVDRVVRILLVAAIGAVIGLKMVAGGLAIGLGVLGLILLATSLVGYCPIYAPFGIKTCKVVNPTEVAQTQMFDIDGDAPNKPKA